MQWKLYISNCRWNPPTPPLPPHMSHGSDLPPSRNMSCILSTKRDDGDAPLSSCLNSRWGRRLTGADSSPPADHPSLVPGYKERHWAAPPPAPHNWVLGLTSRSKRIRPTGEVMDQEKEKIGISYRILIHPAFHLSNSDRLEMDWSCDRGDVMPFIIMPSDFSSCLSYFTAIVET